MLCIVLCRGSSASVYEDNLLDRLRGKKNRLVVFEVSRKNKPEWRSRLSLLRCEGSRATKRESYQRGWASPHTDFVRSGSSPFCSS